MKLIFATSLVFIKLASFNNCNSTFTVAGEKLIQKPYDSKELLSNSEQEIVNALPDDKKTKAKNWFIKNAEEKRELQKKIGYHSIECASQVANGILEYFFKSPPYAEGAFRGIFFVPLFEEDKCKTLPALYDKKFDELDRQVGKDGRFTRKGITKVFRQWYRALSRNIFPVLECINEKLHNYHKNNPDLCDRDFFYIASQFFCLSRCITRGI